ncbi:MAG: hypothetical protein JWL93_868 [Hyphomicrobiales bacterium]|jgi:hypothetical protein|nr:hypothetical protein [Hyphomicrobiales bacterium]
MNLRHSAEDETNSEVIHLGSDGLSRSGATRWGFYLVVFMRIVGVLWLAQGLLQWQAILAPGDFPLDALPRLEAVAIVFFAVINLVAAVGLWLAAPWGGVLWLFAAAAQMFMTVFLPGLQPGGRLLLAFDVTLIVAYFVLTWYAAQERDAL